MSLYAHLIVVMLLATVLTPLLGTVPLRGWRWDRQCWWLLGLLSIGMPLAAGHRFARILLPGGSAPSSAPSHWPVWMRCFALQQQGGTTRGLLVAAAGSRLRGGRFLGDAGVGARCSHCKRKRHEPILRHYGHPFRVAGELFAQTGIVVALLLALDGPDGRSHGGQTDTPRVERTARIGRVLLGGMMLVCLRGRPDAAMDEAAPRRTRRAGLPGLRRLRS